METVTEAPRKPLHRLTAWLSGGPADREAEPARRSAPAGRPLSSDQISPQPQEIDGPRITYAQGGRFAAVKIPTCKPGKPGKRSKISGFSARARKKLLDVVNSIDQGQAQASDFAFVTLTYPAAFPTAQASKRDLDAFIKRMEREYGHRWLIWKLEPQTRGAPHFHLLVYVGELFDASQVCTWVAHEWHEIAGGGDPFHLKWHLGQLGNRPCVEQVRDWKSVSSYAGKYLGKVCQGDEDWHEPGRYWGQRRGDLAPITLITQQVSFKQAVRLRRQCVRYHEHQLSGWLYIPGKRRLDGKHRPGRKLHRRQLLDGVAVGDQIAHLGEVLEVQIRPLKRRWRGRRGGWSGYMPVEMFKRLVAWSATANCSSHAQDGGSQ